ncbi:MAG TPA: hypothetical protein VFD38_16210 [Myxococcaceae bacterium]|nr:hypothetical protein [Myxococcaceae bacterium]
MPFRHVVLVAHEYVWRLLLLRAIELEDARRWAVVKTLTAALLRVLMREVARTLGRKEPLGPEILDEPGATVDGVAVERVIDAVVAALHASDDVRVVEAGAKLLRSTLRALLDRHRVEEPWPGPGRPPPGSRGGPVPAEARVAIPHIERSRPPSRRPEFEVERSRIHEELVGGGEMKDAPGLPPSRPSCARRLPPSPSAPPPSFEGRPPGGFPAEVRVSEAPQRPDLPEDNPDGREVLTGVRGGVE